VAVAGEVTLKVTEESVEPGEIVLELELKVQVQPEGQIDGVRLKVEEPQAELSMLVI
jgi:hypothetical protein